VRAGGDNFPTVLARYRDVTRPLRSFSVPKTVRPRTRLAMRKLIFACAVVIGGLAPRSSSATPSTGALENGLRIIEANYLFAEELDADRLLGSALEFVEAVVPQVEAHKASSPGYVIAAGECELHLEVRKGARLTDLATPLAAVAELVSRCVSDPPEKLPSPSAMLLNGVLSDLDPYSTVFDSRGKTEHTIQFRGKLAGIGAKIGTRRDALTLLTVYAESPAARAGLQDKDRVMRIDGVSTVNMAVADAVERIRGDVGTDVVLTVRRDGVDDPVEIKVTRGLVTIPSVDARLLESGNIYAAISHFSQTTPDDFRQRVAALMGANRKRGVIIDLRTNSGGSMLGSSAIADTFLDKGLLITTAGRNGTRATGLTDEVSAKPDTPFRNCPVVILTSPRTASGSELMSASLRNNDRAIFVGQRTFGKGTVQKTYALGKDEALKLTVGNFLPKGLAIPADGLMPDVEIRTLVLTARGYRLPVERTPGKKTEFWKRNPAWLTVEPERTPAVLSFLRDTADADDDPHEGEEDDLDETLPDDLLGDPAISVADDILRRFGATSATRMLSAAAPFLAERSRQATDDVERTLAEKGIDWSGEEASPASGTGAEKTEPDLSVVLNSDSRILRAGVEETLELSVTNRGSRTLRRVWAALDSGVGFLRGLGVVIGRIEPGATVKLPVDVKPPIDLRLARLPVYVVVENDKGTLGRYGPYPLVVEEAERPILAYRASVTAGNSANVVELDVHVTNRGKAASGELRLQLQQPEAGIAELLEGTTRFPPLAPGETVETRLHVKLLTRRDQAPTVNLVIVDTVFRTFSESKIQLIETEGDWLEPPRISLSRFESVTDGQSPARSILAFITDDKGITQVRASVDGNRVTFADFSGRPAPSKGVELPWEIGAESKRYEIIATDADGLVSRYVTQL
jgi:carboxyl-terminal processing protease